MLIRIIYKIWNSFWKILLFCLLTAIVLAGVVLLLLQTQIGKNTTAAYIQNWFNDRYEGELTIGELDGRLPFWADATDLLITHESSEGQIDTVAHAERVEFRPEWGDVFTRRFSLHDIRVQKAHLNLDFSESYEVKAFKPRQTERDIAEEITGRALYLPNIRIDESSISISNLYDGNDAFHIPDNIRITDINTTAFAEAGDGTFFINVDEFGSSLSGLPTESLNLAGQFYADGSTLELNGFQLDTGNSSTAFNARLSNFSSIDDIRPDNSDLNYRFNLRRGDIALNEWTSVFAQLDRYPYPVSVSGVLEGDSRQIDVTGLNLQGEGFHMQGSGMAYHPFDPEQRAYTVHFDDLRAGPNEMALLGAEPYVENFNDWDALTASGSFTQNPDSLDLETEIRFPEGSFAINATAGLNDSTVTGSYEVDNFISSNLPSLGITETRLNGTGDFSFRGWRPEDMAGEFSLDIKDSGFDQVSIQEGQFAGIVEGQSISTDYSWQFNSGRMEGEGTYYFGGEHRRFVSKGASSGLDLSQFRPYWEGFPETALNFDYEIDIEGESVEEVFGYTQVDIAESAINGDTLRAHQLYLDLDAPTADEARNLRFTSSFLDLIVYGQLNPVDLYHQAGYWGGYLYEQLVREVALDEPDTGFRQYFADRIGDDEMELEASFNMKDLELLRSYYVDFPPLTTFAEAELNLNMSRDSFVLSGGFQDPEFAWQRVGGNEIDGFVSARFQSEGTIREYGEIDFNLRSEEFRFDDYEGGSLSIDAVLSDGFLESRLDLINIGENVDVTSHTATELRVGEVSNQIRELEFGSPDYLWKLEQHTELVYSEDGRLTLSPFIMVNEDQLFSAEGVFSADESDSVSYRIRDVNLGRISDLIDGRIPFEGTMNGQFITRTLAETPFFEGNIRADNFAIDGRPIGEITLASSYNINDRRFETELDIFTDPEIYADYLEQNNGVGQDISLSGYFVEPNWDNPSEEFFYFDGEFDQVDLWVLPYIVTDVFEDVEGVGYGSGYLSGSLEDFDFNGNFEISDSDVEPVFFETLYTITGNVDIDRHDGVSLNDLQVVDGRGGTGTLNGEVGFNDFEPEKGIDITFEMNDLLFLNNSFDPDIPFYGSVYGTGTVRAHGTNISPVVSTPGTVRLSSNSRLSVPMLGGGEIEDQRRFIRFVREFGEEDFSADELRQAGVVGELDRSFTETFTLDLEFEAPQRLGVELLFDPVTGEVLTSTGTGRMRITLEDEEYGMIGRYDIESGDYRFVGGDIFTRRFNLREGGSIIWDGDPVNARLNIEAAYRSRPDINALLETGDADMRAQRIPVDLILELTGTIQEVENDFYFEFPNAIDATQNAAVLSVLNSEDQKLLQATALLLTGGFIPVGQDGFAQAQQFSTTVQARAGEVGLSQLVSAQINELLNTNLANLDIDLNLIGFDQADLGIALRLFDDRLELRRDGQVTGEQEYILGDLGATYRINQTFSVEVFHRKDPTLIGVIGPQAQQESVNGVGLEAQVQFNTWQELQQRVTGAFRRLFGREEEEPEEEDDEPEGIAEES